MMLGTISSSVSRQTARAGTVPSGATWHLDFVNQVYFSGGEFHLVTGLLGIGFNPGDIGPTGMDTSSTTTNRPEAIGPLLTDIQTLLAGGGMTVVVEIDGTIYGEFIDIINNTDPNSATNAIEAYAQANIALDDWNSLHVVGGTTPASSGIHRMAFTMFRDVGGGNFESAVSFDGSAAVTQTTAYGPPFVPATVGMLHAWDIGVYGSGWVCRSITGYPAQLPADLPALTT